MKTITAYIFDNNFYFNGTCLVQADPKSKEWLIPSDCTLTKPELKAGYFYKFNEDENEWQAEKMPENCEECLDIEIEHSDISSRAVELREIFKELTDKDDNYVLHYDSSLTLSVVKKEIKHKTVDELKAEKLSELKTLCHNFDDRLVNNDMFIISSLGFQVNADLRSQNNIKGLIAVNDDVVNFVDYDNEVHKLTPSDLNILLIECSKNGENLYKQKWAYVEKIKACETVEELDQINFNFTMLDFSKGV